MAYLIKDNEYILSYHLAWESAAISSTAYLINDNAYFVLSFT